jgi:hypothetical protein
MYQNIDGGIYAFASTIDPTTGILIDNIIYSYSVTNPIFSSDIPTNITLDINTLNVISLYVTDEYFLNSTYKQVYIYVPVLETKYCIDYANNQISDSIFEYENKNNLTGIALLINQFLWFLRFPYNFLKYFGLLEIGQLAITIAYLYVLAYMFYSNHSKGGSMDLSNLITVAFFIGTIIFIMGLLLSFVFIIVLFLFAINIYSTLHKQSG